MHQRLCWRARRCSGRWRVLRPSRRRMPGPVPTSGVPSATSSAHPFPSATASTTAPKHPPTHPALPLAGRTVVIDPGHNGGNASDPAFINQLVPAGGFDKPCDTAGTETDDGYPEYAFTLDVAERAASLLRGEGARVILTRDTSNGVGPCVNVRAAIGNFAHADAAISIHADGGPATGLGFHVIEPSLAPDGGKCRHPRAVGPARPRRPGRVHPSHWRAVRQLHRPAGTHRPQRSRRPEPLARSEGIHRMRQHAQRLGCASCQRSRPGASRPPRDIANGITQYLEG